MSEQVIELKQEIARIYNNDGAVKSLIMPIIPEVLQSAAIGLWPVRSGTKVLYFFSFSV
jgi:hypothetical protein